VKNEMNGHWEKRKEEISSLEVVHEREEGRER
jgi:hypothetical protein